LGDEELSKFELVWRALNGQKLTPEYRFHPTRRWRIDWWHESGVAIELEGGIWSRGRHTTGKGFLGDMEKYNALAERGVLLFRVPSHQITAQWLSPIIQTISRGGSMSYLSLMREVQDA